MNKDDKTSKPQNLKTSKPQNLKTSKPQNLKTSKPQNLKTSKPQNLKTSKPQNLKTSKPQNLKKRSVERDSSKNRVKNFNDLEWAIVDEEEIDFENMTMEMPAAGAPGCCNWGK